MLDPEFVSMLACPEDKGPLLYFAEEGFFYNPRLKRRYEIHDDVPVMLIDESTTVDEPEHERIMASAAEQGIGPSFEE
ncbi:MAG: hypothetical protein CME06_06730 [Gemmatimonadetes bacterium]|nr:hypothetical protein [Gemmatimonadota bacterium]